MHAWDARHDLSYFFALLLKRLQVIPENLEGERTLSAGEGFADVVFDRLRKVPDRSRASFFELAVHGGDQFFLVLTKYRPPLVVWLQVNEIFCVAESPGVGSVIGPANLRYHGFHFRERREDIAGAGCEPLALRKTRAVREGAARPDGAFVQMRQKLRTNHSAEPQEQAYAQRRQTGADRDYTMIDAPAHSPAVALGQISHDRVMPLPNSSAKQHTGQDGCDQDGKSQGAQQCESDGQGHWSKQPTLDSLQCEDRQVSRDDDGDRIEDRSLYLMASLAYRLGDGLNRCSDTPSFGLVGSRSKTALPAAQMANDVFDHDHRAVHDHSEIQRAEREKVGWNLAQVEPYGRKEQGERNGERDDEGRPSVAEKEEEDDRHQNHPFRQVVQHRVRRVVKQIAAVQHGHDRHAGRQNAVIELVHFLVDCIKRGLLFRAFAH